jgi:hypothetical protein
MPDLPIACALSPDELRARGDQLLPGLAAVASAKAPLPDGLRLEFAPSSELLARVAGVIDDERQCCPFLRFTLGVAPAGGPVTLDVTGPPGTREILAELVERQGVPSIKY